MILRDYQQRQRDAIYEAWGRCRAPLAVAPTGSGKTVLFSSILAAEVGRSVAIAHRQEIVCQISLSLARNGVAHRIIGGAGIVRECAELQSAEGVRVMINQNAKVAVAGVDTLIRRDEPWFKDVSLWVMDEAHHVLRRNKWGKAVAMFPNARGLGVTATPMRLDGRGLGAHADGVFDELVEGPVMRGLIHEGHLTDYRIIAPPSRLHLEAVPVSAGGDYSPKPLSSAVHEAKITGDAVKHYLRYASGMCGIIFTVDVDAARETAAAYRAAGVPTEMISANTPSSLRASILRKLRSGLITQVVNVDLFGEGFDLPAIEVVTMLRPTASFVLYCQQFGRGLRTLEGKDKALIIDHVGNVLRHGLPDAPRVWTLDAQDKKSRGSATPTILLRPCLSCHGVYERFHLACPYCGHVPEPASRSAPDYVDGDLSELSPEVLAKLRGEIAQANAAPQYPLGASAAIRGALDKHHRARQEMQKQLQEAMALWGGARTAEGLSLAEAQKVFYLRFGVDVATAQTLNRADAEQLLRRIEGWMT